MLFYREANALKTQSSELAEAERLEREALLRRERAVAHGKSFGSTLEAFSHTTIDRCTS